MLRVINDGGRFFYAKGLPFPPKEVQYLPDDQRGLIEGLIGRGLPLRIVNVEPPKSPVPEMPAAEEVAETVPAPAVEPEVEEDEPEVEEAPEPEAKPAPKSSSKKRPRRRKAPAKGMSDGG